MSRTTLKSLASLTLIGALAAPVTMAQDPVPPASTQAEPEQLFTIEELDNLLARVALYPDPLLAQVFVAATFPEQIALAARYVRTYGQDRIDDQAWDVSVKAVAHYPPVLNLLDEDPDWTTALGQAYALQEGDVMASVQGLRRMAHAQGNLVTTAEQKVEVEPQYIRIVPAQPKVIYVPTYDPEIIYYRPVHYHHVHSPHWTFGFGFPIGVWLTYDFDWGHRVVYYHGWDGYGRHHTWYHASRPFIYINSIYVNPWRTVVVINRRVTHRYVDYRRFNRYTGIHRRVTWDRRGLPGMDDGRRVAQDRRAEGRYPARGSVSRTSTTRAVTPGATTTRSTTTTRSSTTGPTTTRATTTRATTTRATTTRTTTSRTQARATPAREAQPSRNGTWNPRPASEPRVTPSREDVPQRTSMTRTSMTPTSVPRTSVPRTSEPQATAPSRTSVPRASVPRTSEPRASAPRTSAPSRASAPKASAPKASAPSRSAPSRSAPARSTSRDRKG